jgi:uncharacterized sulfatase
MQPLAMSAASGAGLELVDGTPDMDRLTEQFFRRGLQFIEDNRDRPFFLMLALTAPHIPLDPHPDHAGRSAAAEYGDVVEEIDAWTGALIAKLKSLGIDDDTLVMVTSDNGPWFEGSAGGLRDRKGGAGWEGGYRTPFIARHPGRIPAGLSNDAIAMNIDLLPTFLSWAGASPAPGVIDGADISALLLSAGASSPHEALILFNNEEIAAIRTQRWKYVVRSHYRTIEAQLDRIGRPDWTVLVDMQTDPEEAYDMSARHPAVLADMEARLVAARALFEPMRRAAPAAPR